MTEKTSINLAVRLVRAYKLAQTEKWSFLALSACTLFVIVFTLGKLDLLPEAPVAPVVAAHATTTPVRVVTELPMQISIPVINLSATISNPTSTVIADLDEELKKGAVRYPTSAKLGESGNVVLFGHSSYLPVVLNQAYKTFNGIQKLSAGDVITVSSKGTAYTYHVRTVSKESTNDAGIPLKVAGRVLTLSTCDSFGATTDRFVVVADFVESHPISI